MNNCKVKNSLKLMAYFAFGAGFGITAACKKPAPADSSKESAATEQLAMPSSRPVDSAPTAVPVGPEMERALDERYAENPAKKEEMRQTMNELDARFSAEDRLAEIHRRTMVTPAPPGFKPGSSAREIRLKLILEKQKIRAGEYPRFRLEMTNVGRETIDYHENTSSIFVKGGNLLDSRTINFFLTDSRNKRTKLTSRLFPLQSMARSRPEKPEAAPSGLSEAEMEKWFAEANAMGQAHATFKVKLLPGETLHSIGDEDSLVENFKTLLAEGGFKKPGKYQLQVELDDRPRPLSKGYVEAALTYSTLEQIHKSHERRMKEALGPVVSNVATLEVAQ